MRKNYNSFSGVVYKTAKSSIKVLFLLWVFLILTYSNVIAQTTIPDGTDVFGTWDIAGSPYLVQGEAIVPTDSTLTIEPGVEIRFKTGTNFNYTGGYDCGFLRVNGKLLAQGTASQMITFTRDGASDNWGIIYFPDGSDDNSIMEYCKVEYGYKIDNISGSSDFSSAISIISASPTIINSWVLNNANTGLYCGSSNSKIIGCLLNDNSGYGIQCSNYYSYNPQLINNTTANNGNYGIHLSYGNTVLKNCISWGNGNNGLYASQGNTQVANCLLQNTGLPSYTTDLGGNTFGFNPHFTDETSFDYSLLLNSPAIQSGDTTGISNQIPDFDLAGNARIFDNTIEIGAYEYSSFSGDYLRIVSPNGYEAWMGNENQEIRWESNVANVKLEYSDDAGASWNLIVASTPNDGTYDWTLPVAESDTCLVKVTDVANASINDQCDNMFTIFTHNIPDGSLLYGVLPLINSPYYFNGEVTIPTDSTLTIEAGVEIKFKTGTNFNYTGGYDCGFLRVNGKLLAQGTASQMITFTRDGASDNWGIIYFPDGSDDNSIMEYCKVEYGYKIDNISGSSDFSSAISIISASPTIINSWVLNNANTGLYCGSSNSKIIGCLVNDNSGYGIQCSNYYSYNPQLINNTTANNGNYGIHISYGNTVLKNCISWGNGNNGLYASQGNTQVANCLLQNTGLPSYTTDLGGNIFDTAPDFVDEPNNNFRINYSSVCRNAGTPDTTGLNLPIYDLAGNTRIMTDTVDMGAYEAYSISSGLVAHYPFNGNAIDESGYENHGVVIGATLTTDRFGYTNAAYYFDGNDDVITVADAPSLNPENFTLSAWFNQTQGQGIFSKIINKYKFFDQEGYGISIDQNNNLVAGEMFDNTNAYYKTESVTNVTNGVWAHAACTFNGSTIALYVNGVLEDELPVSNPLLNSGIDLTFGNAEEFGMTFPFNGVIDDIKIYDRALIAEEISELYNTCTFKLNLPDTIMTCHEDSVLLEPGAGFLSYEWSTGDTTEILYAKETGTYYVDVTDVNGCTAIDSTYVNIINVYIEQGDTAILIGDSIELSLGTTYYNHPLSLNGFSYQGELNGHNYYISTNSEYWIDAKSTCESVGGHLITIENQIENDFVLGMYPGSDIWIGLTDEIQEGSFQWVTNEYFSYTNWDVNQPDNYNNEDYTEMRPNGKWNDKPSNVYQYYVLEFDPPSISLDILWSTGDTTTSITVTPNLTTTYTVEITDGVNWCTDTVTINVVEDMELDLTVMLEGPYNTGNGTMMNWLNFWGYIPTTQPYNTAPWFYGGLENVPSIPNADVTDWLLLDLRYSSSGSATATSDSLIAQKAVFLLKDGTIVDTSGTNNPVFRIEAGKQIYPVIRHRNHVPIMSSNPLTESSGVYTYDFTTGPDKVYGGAKACIEIDTGVWGMIGGDGNADGQINNRDKNDEWLPNYNVSSYNNGDFDMNGVVNDADKNNMWEPKVGTGNMLPE